MDAQRSSRRGRRSWTVEQLEAAVTDERSLAGVPRRLGLRAAGGNYVHVTSFIRSRGLSTQHFTGSAHLRGRKNPHPWRTPIERVLVAGLLFQSSHLRKRLLAEGLLPAQCATCGGTQWRGHRIPLELDHIDGDRYNNNLTNLRVLCPNCHALTPTYRGRYKALRRASA
jgi:hypothetical protein